MEIVTIESKAKEVSRECRSHRTLRDNTRHDNTHTHTHSKDIGQLPERLRDKEIEESFFLC